MKTKEILLGSLFLWVLCACTWGPVPITAGFGGYGVDAHATVVIPQRPAQIVPVVKSAVDQPMLLVPTGTATSDTATAMTKTGTAIVPVVESAVSTPTLAVPR